MNNIKTESIRRNEKKTIDLWGNLGGHGFSHIDEELRTHLLG